jgi:hypothetical protein
MIKVVIWLLLLSSCAGYKWTERNNPLARHGINSISIPMFLNQSNLNEVAGLFTSQLIEVMSGFDGLRVVPGFDENTDAVLIGKIKSPEKLSQTLAQQGIRVANTVASESIGGSRGDFYIPSATGINLSVEYIIIKKPTKDELEFFLSKYADQIIADQKVVLKENIPVLDVFTREVYDGEAGRVNYTQNRGAMKKTLYNMAVNTTNQFRDMILYAF